MTSCLASIIRTENGFLLLAFLLFTDVQSSYIRRCRERKGLVVIWVLTLKVKAVFENNHLQTHGFVRFEYGIRPSK